MMVRYIATRIVLTIPVMFGITILVFLVSALAPGDPLLAMMNPDVPTAPELVEARREHLGLNEPIPVRYVIWLRELVQGNLGYSFATGQPILEIIVGRLPATLRLMVSAMLIAVVLGVSLGVISAIRKNTVIDYLVTVFSLVWVSIPGFFFGLVLIYFFSLRLGWLPSFGMRTVGEPASFTDQVAHLILPALMLGLERTAAFARYTRAAVLDVLNREYILTARAKGIVEPAVIGHHALRNALIPIVTLIGLSLPALFGGSVLAETVFQWPGMGLLYIQAVGQRDYPLIMGLAVFSSLMVLVANLLADICYAFVDPRVKVGS